MSDDNQDVNQTNGNESTNGQPASSAGEQAEQLTPEQISSMKAELQKTKEEAARLKENLRHQAEKHEKEKPQVPSASVPAEELEQLKRDIEYVKQDVEARAEDQRTTALSWVKQQSWFTQYSSDNDPEGKQLAQFNEAVKLANEKNHPVTQQDFQRNLLRAHRFVFPDDSIEPMSSQPNQSYARQLAGGSGGSQGKGMTKPRLTKEQIEFAIKCGNDPQALLAN